MKIGFSFGRCVRDIVNGTVAFEDVFLVVAQTAIFDSSQVEDVVDEYLHRPDYLMGLDQGKCYDVATKLYLSGKLFQPRINGHRARYIVEDAVWMDIMPTLMGEDAQSEQVVAAWKQYQLALKMTSLKKYPSKEDAKRLLGDDNF
jgi:hypothetical protein